MPVSFPFCAFFQAVSGAWRDGNQVSATLFRTLIPIILIVKILNELGIIQYLAMPLRPVMTAMGLPAELGLAWAAGILVNVYSGIVVFLGLIVSLPPLSIAQVTTFALVMLVAHNMIIEIRLAGQCGVAMLPQLVIRMGMAVVAGLSMYGLTLVTGTLAEPAHILLEGSPPATWGQWLWEELLNLGKIYLLVWGVMLLQRGLDYFRISYWMGKALHPVLRILGISPQAATIIIVGFSMGLVYGSGAIIKGSHDGSLSPHDVFSSLTILGVAHSLIEDTMLMVVIGASLWGILGLRLILALLLGVCVNLLYTHRPGTKVGTV